MRRVRAGWVRLSPPGDKLSAHWRHHASGFEVRHCGHPTANWPYYVEHPSRPGVMLVTESRFGFRRLAEAQAAVEGLAGGELVTAPAGTYAGADVERVVPARRRR